MNNSVLTLNFKKKESGQVMIISVLSLGAVLIGATTIAGLLMAHQLRQNTDFANSAKAIYAADAGIEWALYSSQTHSSISPPSLSNGASVAVVCSDDLKRVVSCDATSTLIRAVGTAVRSTRALNAAL